MTVIDRPAAATTRRIGRQLLRGLFRRSASPEWEPAKLPRGVTAEMVETWLSEFVTAKENSAPWVKHMERIRALLDDVPSGTYGPYTLKRDKPRRILDQKESKRIIERLGAIVPLTFSRAPVKVRRRGSTTADDN